MSEELRQIRLPSTDPDLWECRSLALENIQYAVECLDYGAEEEHWQPEDVISPAYAFYRQAEAALEEALRRVRDLSAEQVRLFRERLAQAGFDNARSAGGSGSPES